ncbi:HlyD family secretion protein [Kordiimonas sp.]|uniref:HlyD family secretion protein n=1 Tax=Kordiimonas sp. TaxID=1970157 RepID=UPI003A93FD5E
MSIAKRLVGLLIAAAAAGAAWYYNQLDVREGIYTGYVEGEYILLAAPASGVLKSLDVQRGMRVVSGMRVFSLDTTAAEADLAQAQASHAKAVAELADMEKGARAEELSVRSAEIQEAEAALKNAELELTRQQQLEGSTAAVEARLDAARAARDQAKARVAALRSAFEVANLPARADRLDAARAALGEAQANVVKAERRLKEMAPEAPASAMVQDTYYQPGAWVPANKAVVSLLPDDRRKLRFFVPQADVTKLSVGTKVAFSCDGCTQGLTASVSFIAPEAEYTPPVIYSVESREKLVFLIEAVPNGDTLLPVGLPIEVERPE